MTAEQAASGPEAPPEPLTAGTIVVDLTDPGWLAVVVDVYTDDGGVLYDVRSTSLPACRFLTADQVRAATLSGIADHHHSQAEHLIDHYGGVRAEGPLPFRPRQFTERYQQYARVHGYPSPEAALAADQARSGACMARFIIWTGERWAEWRRMHDYAIDRHMKQADHADFDAWLATLPAQDGAPA